MPATRFAMVVTDPNRPADPRSTTSSTLADLPLQPAARVRRCCSLRDTVARMEAEAVSSLLVEGDGIVTERDIARALGHGVPLEASVEAIATWPPITVPASTAIVDAAGIMLNEHVRHLLVRHDEVVAVVSLRDLVALLLEATNPEVWWSTLRVSVEELPAEIWLG